MNAFSKSQRTIFSLWNMRRAYARLLSARLKKSSIGESNAVYIDIVREPGLAIGAQVLAPSYMTGDIPGLFQFIAHAFLLNIPVLRPPR